MIARLWCLLTGRGCKPRYDPATEYRVRALYEMAERDDRVRAELERMRHDGNAIVDVLHRARPPLPQEHRDDR